MFRVYSGTCSHILHAYPGLVSHCLRHTCVYLDVRVYVQVQVQVIYTHTLTCSKLQFLQLCFSVHLDTDVVQVCIVRIFGMACTCTYVFAILHTVQGIYVYTWTHVGAQVYIQVLFIFYARPPQQQVEQGQSNQCRTPGVKFKNKLEIQSYLGQIQSYLGKIQS